MIRSCLVIFTCLMLIQCSRTPQQEAKRKETDDILPSLAIQLTSGEKIKTESLQGKIILVFFNPDCDHCQRQADDIRNNISTFRGYSIYFIGSKTLEELRNFSAAYKLNEYRNVFFATASIENVAEVMGSIGVPSIFIYSDRGELVKRFDSETKVDEIAKFI